MPELPEAQTIAAFLDRNLTGRTIRDLRLMRRDFLKTGTPGALRGLIGRKLAQVTRQGKYVILHAGADRLLIQLGMAGQVYLAHPDAPLEKHAHFAMLLSGQVEMRYANSRRIASGVHVLGPGQAGPLEGLGPDALAISAEEFARNLSRHRTAIKSTLLNQSVLAGVGNVYSDEALFRSRIAPTRPANRLSPAECLRLHQAVGQVLAEAVKVGGSTLKGANPFAGVDGSVGDFTLQHQCYGRYGQPCPRCGRTLQRLTLGGRTSTFCRKCQT